MQKRRLGLPFLARQRQLLKIRRIPLPHARSRARPRSRHHQPPHQVRRLRRNQLRNVAAHGEAEDVDGREAKGADDLDHVVGPDGEGVGDTAGGGANADVVDEQDSAARRGWVEEQQVPVVHRAAKVHVEDERDGRRGGGCRRGGTRSGWRRWLGRRFAPFRRSPFRLYDVSKSLSSKTRKR